jgi:hypothetical protein
MKELLNFLLVLVGNFHAVLLLKPEAISKEARRMPKIHFAAEATNFIEKTCLGEQQ